MLQYIWQIIKEKKTKEEEVDKPSNREELLIKKTEFLKKKINQERLCAKKNCRKNKKAALQALRRKKWYEKQLNQLDRTIEAMTSAHEHMEHKEEDSPGRFAGSCSETVNKVKDPINVITELVLSKSHNSPFNQTGESDEDALQAELEKLEESLDENHIEDDVDLSSSLFPAVSASHSAKMEEEDEEDLEYLRRWGNGSLLEKNLSRTEETVLSSVLSTSLSSHPAELEDDEDEDELEYLQRWLSDCL